MRPFGCSRFVEPSRRAHAHAVRLALVLLLGGGQAQAIDLGLGDSFQLHGFAAQTYHVTNRNNYFGSSEGDGTFEFRELGLNASWRALPRLQASAQVLSRRAGESDDGAPRVDYAFLDFVAFSDATRLAGVRGGRTLIPLGLYNETRDVAFTRPGILLPQSIYFDRTRDVALSGDGAAVYGEYRTPSGDLSLEAGVGRPRAESPEIEQALVGGDIAGDMEGRTSYFGRLLYERDGGALRAAVSAGEINLAFDRGEGVPKAVPDGYRFQPLVLSLQYNAERWTATGEYALRRFTTSGSSVDNPGFTGESWYVQGTYRFAQRWEVMGRYDVLYTDRRDRNGNEFHNADPYQRPAFSRFAKDLAVGLRWDVSDWALLRAEFHNVDGTGWITMLDNDFAGLRRHWNLFALQAALRF